MAEIIIYHKGVYNLYNTISDGPVFCEGLTLKELKEYIKEEKGNQGLVDLETRLPRAWNKGTSAINHDLLKDTIFLNRAGDNEKHLSYDEFIKRFLTLKGD